MEGTEVLLLIAKEVLWPSFASIWPSVKLYFLTCVMLGARSRSFRHHSLAAELCYSININPFQQSRANT